MSHHVNYTIGGLMAIGGITGYAKKRSVPSLVAGVSIGALYAGSGYMIANGNEQAGHDLATAVSVVVTALMSKRAASSGKLMPSGAVAAVAALGAVYNGKKSYDWRNGISFS
eukprot:TRINITY_DN10618_c0_g1_i2.p6 TRINITY_DN10618_c0_g1~~TRINITY_DN10618_c0_g1_i2.p6  ORF type:complete len:112 (+),score=14.73 TRINITY_DN10618_c0_g1_i2:2668-3003(+)